MISRIAAAPVIFSALYFVGTHPIFRMAKFGGEAYVAQSPILIIPYVALTLAPLYLLVVGTVWKASIVTKPVAVALFAFGWVHTFFSTVYGNVNNDAYSNSWMIDVLLPPEMLGELKNIPSDMIISRNGSAWNDKAILDGPHLSPATSCPERAFIRFMFHKILPKSRLSAILTKDHPTFFFGSWVGVEGKDDGRTPRVFTDHAGGNDEKLNAIVIPKFFVDTRNDFMTVDYSELDEEAGKHLLSFTQPFYSPAGLALNAEAKKKYAPNADFTMAQYSCMNEVLMFKAVTGSHICFHKVMDALETTELAGTFEYPGIFGEGHKFTFPSPAADEKDCSKPYVRAVYTKELHWTRNNHLC